MVSHLATSRSARQEWNPSQPPRRRSAARPLTAAAARRTRSPRSPPTRPARPLRDALAAGRSPTLVAGGLDRTLLRFRVAGLTGRPARAVLRLRVTDPTFESVQVRTVPAFAEDAATPAILVPSLFAVGEGRGAEGRARGRSGTSRARWAATAT